MNSDAQVRPLDKAVTGNVRPGTKGCCGSAANLGCFMGPCGVAVPRTNEVPTCCVGCVPDFGWWCLQADPLWYLLAICSIYWHVDSVLARKLIVVWGLGYYVAAASKDMLLLPRPYQVSQDSCPPAVVWCGAALPSLTSGTPLPMVCVGTQVFDTVECLDAAPARSPFIGQSPIPGHLGFSLPSLTAFSLTTFVICSFTHWFDTVRGITPFTHTHTHMHSHIPVVCVLCSCLPCVSCSVCRGGVVSLLPTYSNNL